MPLWTLTQAPSPLGGGKEIFSFRQYDKNAEKGSRITKKTDYYMDITEFGYFCEQMRTLRILEPFTEERERLKKSVARKVNNGELSQQEAKSWFAAQWKSIYPQGYHHQGGTIDENGKCIARQLSIDKSSKDSKDTPVVLRVQSGPGKKNSQGLYVPQYNYSTADVLINIPLSKENMIKMGIEGQRAIRYFDMWSSMGTLNWNIERLRTSYENQDRRPSKVEDHGLMQAFGEFGFLNGSTTSTHEKETHNSEGYRRRSFPQERANVPESASNLF